MVLSVAALANADICSVLFLVICKYVQALNKLQNQRKDCGLCGFFVSDFTTVPDGSPEKGNIQTHRVS